MCLFYYLFSNKSTNDIFPFLFKRQDWERCRGGAAVAGVAAGADLARARVLPRQAQRGDDTGGRGSALCAG